MPIATRNLADILRLIDDLVRQADRVEYRQQIKPVGNMVLVVIADRATQRRHQEQWDFVGVVDLGDRIHDGHEAGRAHQRRRSHRAHIGARTQADRRFLAIDRNMDETIVAFDRVDDVHHPIVGKAGDKLNATRRKLVGDASGAV